MTVIEFFDKDAIENIVSSLLCNPDKVIFIGDKFKAMQRAIEKYNLIVNKRGKSIEFSAISITRNNLQSIVGVLSELVQDSEEIVLDLTGGEDLYLVAAGIVHNCYPEKVKLHRFNINNGKFYDCDADGNVLVSSTENLTVEENISIYGGCVVFDDENPQATHIWDFNEEFISDINLMWRICCEDTKEWNKTMSRISSEEEMLDEDDLVLESADNSFWAIPDVVVKLQENGIISDYKLLNGVLSFVCKNPQVKRCLMKAGQLLELKITAIILSLNETTDEKMPHDILTGVVIRWDDEKENKSTVTNEVDVLAMKGLAPVFISCKNGIVDVNELYKLNTVAARFGGKYAKKVLVATYELGSIVKRAEEMNIRVIDNVGDLNPDDNALKSKFENIFSK